MTIQEKTATPTIGEQVLDQIKDMKIKLTEGGASKELMQVLDILANTPPELILKESRRLKKENPEVYKEYTRLLEKPVESYNSVDGIDRRILCTEEEAKIGSFPAMRKLQAIRDEMKGSREHIEELIAKYNTAVFLAQKEKDPNAIQKIKEEGAFRNSMDTRNIRSNNGGNVSFKEDTPYLVLVRKEHGSPYPVEVVFEKERSYGDRHCYFRDIDTEEDAAKILEGYHIQ